MDQFRRELPRHAAALGDRPEVQADDADIDPDRPRHEPPIVAAPVVASTACLKRSATSTASAQPREVGDQETELVAAEPARGDRERRRRRSSARKSSERI